MHVLKGSNSIKQGEHEVLIMGLNYSTQQILSYHMDEALVVNLNHKVDLIKTTVKMESLSSSPSVASKRKKWKKKDEAG